MFHSTDSSKLLRLCQDMRWIEINESGEIILSNTGNIINSLSSEIEKLRYQLKSLILYFQPPWARIALHGRTELLKTISEPILQCFEEAKVTESYDEEVLSWWDELARQQRRIAQDDRISIGRVGERLSYNFEYGRTGRIPKWLSVESNSYGFDILSIQSKENEGNLRIEVKASKMDISESQLYFTRNEYEKASVNTTNYIFHLWSISETVKNRLLIVPFDEMHNHFPSDCGNGEWQLVKIPFSVFNWDSAVSFA